MVATCNVEGCNSEGERSIAFSRVNNVLKNLTVKSGNVHLCKRHYKEWKKKTKKERELERAAW